MTENLKNALNLLKSSDYTCVLLSDEKSIESTERGVLPLLKLYDSRGSFSSYCAADKVIGKAAAMLYILLGIKEIYALIISDAAAEVFTKHDITFFYDKKVPRILNRTGTGFCPMEEAVINIDEPFAALDAIKAKLDFLNNKQ